jgi:O-antigen ligase
MQGTYYHWFRDVALGKITELPFYFYRLVLNEHLLLVPAMLYFAWRVLKREAQKYEYGILAASLFILSISVTRIYILALGAGLVTLATRHEWKRWLVVCAGILASFVGIFTFVHLAASRGQSLGWELFGVRLQSIVTPAIEDSALSRLLLLPKILEKIKAHPLLGTGLGDTVTVYSPVFKANITTPHFDWGYLEILAELGLLGGVAWLTFLYRIGARLWATTRPAWQHAALASILVINLTSPALFHALGIVLLVLLAA